MIYILLLLFFVSTLLLNVIPFLALLPICALKCYKMKVHSLQVAAKEGPNRIERGTKVGHYTPLWSLFNGSLGELCSIRIYCENEPWEALIVVNIGK